MIEHSKEELITRQLDDLETYVAPDGSIIREMPEFPAGGLSHCTVPEDMVSKAVKHRTIEEIWYCISGYGEFWRAFDYKEPVVIDIKPGTSLNIPCGAMFQFGNNGKWDNKEKKRISKEPLVFIIATIPQWPGDQEAVPVKGYWATS